MKWVLLAVLGIALGGVAEGSIQGPPSIRKAPPKVRECDLCGKPVKAVVFHPVHGRICRPCAADVRSEELGRK
jgi:hypothetical protein